MTTGSRGGTLARYEGRDRKLEAARTAVLIVDAQNAELEPEVLEKHPEFATALKRRALPAMRRLVEGGRARGVEIVYTVIEALTSDGRDRSLEELAGRAMPDGSPYLAVLREYACPGCATLLAVDVWCETLGGDEDLLDIALEVAPT